MERFECMVEKDKHMRTIYYACLVVSRKMIGNEINWPSAPGISCDESEKEQFPRYKNYERKVMKCKDYLFYNNKKKPENPSIHSCYITS